MAKGLRSSVKKAHRSKLRDRIFAPVEDARTARLHAKLLEAAQAPKPEPASKSAMDVDSAEPPEAAGNSPQETATAAPQEADKDEYPKGSCFLSTPIPPSIAPGHTAERDRGRDARELRELYHYLGLCSDVVGFTAGGEVEFAFEPLPQWLSAQGLTEYD